MRRNRALLLLVIIFTATIVLGTMPAKAAVIPKLQMVTQPVQNYKNGERVSFTVTSPNYGGKVEYRVILYNGTTKKTSNLWNTPKTGYYYKNWQPAGNYKFAIHWPVSQMEPGAYSLTVLVRRVGAKTSYDSFVNTKAFWVVNNATSSFQGDGNTASNVFNDGYVIERDGFTYFAGDGIVKRKADGTYVKDIAFGQAKDMNMTDKYIFYINPQDNSSIYRVNIDGSGKTRLNGTEWSDYLLVSGNNIYYKNLEDKYTIYRMNQDGSSKLRYDSEGSSFYTFTKDHIYFNVPTDSGMKQLLYRINKDGTGKTLISDKRSYYQPIVSGEYIYFTEPLSNFSLAKMKLDGTDYTKLADDSTMSLNIKGDWLYYSNESEGGKIYRIRTDGTQRGKLNEETSINLNIIGDYIYFEDKNDYNQRKKIKIVEPPKETSVDKYQQGNNIGNIYNGAFAAQQGDYMYVGDYANGGINRYNLGGTGEKLIAKNFSVPNMNILGDWIYYTATWGEIYKTRLDGTGGQVLVSKGPAAQIIAVGDYIYYSKGYSEGFTEHYQPVYKVRTDGTGETWVDIGMYAYSFNVVGEWVYYIERNDGNKIYKIKTDGTGKTKISDIEGSSLRATEEYLYIGVQDNTYLGKEVIRTSLNGENPILVSSEPRANLIIANDKMFYTKSSGVYSSNLDGTSETFIVKNQDNTTINIAGNYLFYKEQGKVCWQKFDIKNWKPVIDEVTDGRYVSLNTTLEKAIEILGEPLSKTESYPVAEYRFKKGLTLYIENGIVKGWNNIENPRVSLGQKDPNAVPFTIGSSMDEVVKAMGTPYYVDPYNNLEPSMYKGLWKYADKSTIYFDKNLRVIGYTNEGSLKVDMGQKDPSSPSLNLSSTSKEIIKAMGTPYAIRNYLNESYSTWYYKEGLNSSSIIISKYTGKIIGYYNGGNLKINLGDKDPLAQDITSNSTQEDVIKAMGTPDEIIATYTDKTSWRYGSKYINFTKDGKVIL